MRNPFKFNSQTGGEKRDWLVILLKSRVIPILSLALVALVSVGIVLYRNIIASMGIYGYPSIFLLSMIWNSTVLVPIPSFPMYFFLGAIFNPVIVAIVGAAGAAVGEMTSYLVGYSGQEILQPQKRKIYIRVENWIKKWGFMAIFAFNFVPVFPFDLFGIAAGVMRFPLWKFYLACLAGRSIAYGFIAFAGSQGWIPPLPFLNPP